MRFRVVSALRVSVPGSRRHRACAAPPGNVPPVHRQLFGQVVQVHLRLHGPRRQLLDLGFQGIYFAHRFIFRPKSPLTLSLSPWERERSNYRCGSFRGPFSHGEKDRMRGGALGHCRDSNTSRLREISRSWRGHRSRASRPPPPAFRGSRSRSGARRAGAC